MTLSRCRAYLDGLERFGVKLGLNNIRRLCAALGDPQLRFPSVLVAGTNGKGSVCAMLSRSLTLAGYKTGLYTSPHLVRPEERIRLDGVMIPESRFCRILERIRGAVENLRRSGEAPVRPTYFEVLTATAFLHFSRERADIAVLEVGLGGRFDATNIVDPLVSVITTISRDHERQLGRTLGRIAFEKAGILRPGIPVVCGPDRGDAARVIERRARELKAPFVPVFGADSRLEETLRLRDGRGIFLFERNGVRRRLAPSLPGSHQGKNAAVAAVCAEVLDQTWKPVRWKAVSAGIRTASWEARLEIVSRRPLVILDGAHNVEGAEALRDHIRRGVGRKVILLFAVMKDKDVAGLARRLFPEAETVILTRVPQDRAADPEDIAARTGKFRDRIRFEPDPAAACLLARRLSAGRIPIVAAGSLFLAGEIKRLGCFSEERHDGSHRR